MAFLKHLPSSGAKVMELAEDQINYFTVQNGALARSNMRTKDVQAALLRMPRGWVVLDYSGHRTFVNGLRVAEFKLVREGDMIEIGALRSQLIEIRRETLREGSEALQFRDDKPQVCFVDYGAFQVGDEVVYCPVCGAPHHADCWTYAGQRCVAGCGYRRPRVAEDGPA